MKDFAAVCLTYLAFIFIQNRHTIIGSMLDTTNNQKLNFPEISQIRNLLKTCFV
jgi:hypothetical protein